MPLRVVQTVIMCYRLISESARASRASRDEPRISQSDYRYRACMSERWWRSHIKHSAGCHHIRVSAEGCGQVTVGSAVTLASTCPVVTTLQRRFTACSKKHFKSDNFAHGFDISRKA